VAEPPTGIDERRQSCDTPGHAGLAQTSAIRQGVAMALIFVFLLGVGNFAMHQAVRQSGHPLLGQMPWFYHMLGGRMSLVIEFGMLLSSMLMVSQGSLGWAWGYAFYTVANAVSAWLIIDRRI